MDDPIREPIKINLTTLITILMMGLLFVAIVIYYFSSNTTTGKTVYEDVAMKQEKKEKYRKYVITDTENTLAENVLENTIIENSISSEAVVEDTLSLEDAKAIITKYFVLKESKDKTPKAFLESLNLVNKFSFTKDEFITSSDGLAYLYKTNINYADYKTKLLETMSERMFDENFRVKFEENGGILYFEGDIATEVDTYNFTDIEVINSVGIISDYKATYTKEDGTKRSLQVRLVKNGDKYVIDSYEIFLK